MSSPTASGLDVEFCRAQFPEMGNGWAYMDNAGGSYVPRSVVDRMVAFLTESKNQPWRHTEPGRLSGERMDAAHAAIAEMINADPGEIILGPSTTANTYTLAQALRPMLQPGDEIVVSQQDHEANRGAWLRLAEFGVTIVEWPIDPVTGLLDTAVLQGLLTARTRLVCVTHASNVVAAINPVAEIARMAHGVGAMVVVDGVAYAGHALVDVKALGADFYLFSLYKVYGPHQGVLYASAGALKHTRNQRHFFYDGNFTATRLHPAGNQYELVAASRGVADYFDAVYAHHFRDNEPSLHERAKKVFALFGEQEDALGTALIDGLRALPGVRVLGPQTGDRTVRMPTVAFHVPGRSSKAIAQALAASKCVVAYGHFYAPRCVAALGITDVDDGVVRISLLHYNTLAEVQTVLAGLRDVLS